MIEREEKAPTFKLPSIQELTMILGLFLLPTDHAEAKWADEKHPAAIIDLVGELKVSLPHTDRIAKNLFERLQELLRPPFASKIISSGITVIESVEEQTNHEKVEQYYTLLKEIRDGLTQSEELRTHFTQTFTFPRRNKPINLNQSVESQESSAMLRESLSDLSRKIRNIVESPDEDHPSIRAAYKKIRFETQKQPDHQ